MIILHALALHCIIAHGQYPLNKPAQVDPTGCKKLIVRSNYIEYGVVDGKRTKFGLSFTQGTSEAPIIIDDLDWSHNVEVNLRPDGTLPPGYTKKGCESGWTWRYEMVGTNAWVWCDPGIRRGA